MYQMHFCSKQWKYRAAPRKSRLSTPVITVSYFFVLFDLTANIAQSDWSTDLIPPCALSELFTIFKAITAVQTSDDISERKCKQGTILAYKILIIGDNWWDEKKPIWFSKHKLSIHGWQYLNIYLNERTWYTETFTGNKHVPPETLFPFLPFTESLSKATMSFMTKTMLLY